MGAKENPFPEPGYGVANTSNHSNRNSTEIEADRLFVLKLLQSSGKELSIQEVTDALNARRAEGSRQLALALGKSEEEAEEEANSSALTKAQVAGDIGAVRNSLHYAIQAGAAGWLDAQIKELQRDREQTYAIDEMALAELERSRKFRSRQVRGLPVFGDEEEGEVDEQVREVVDRAIKTGKVGRIPQVNSKPKRSTLNKGNVGLQAVEVTEREDEQGGSPRFLEILNNNIRRRMELRAEERMLMFGREWAKRVKKSEEASAATFATLLTGNKSVEEAERAVLEAYQKELQQLVLADEMELGPSDPALVKMERLRVQRQHDRLNELRELMKIQRQGTEGPKVIEVVFEKVEPGKFREVKQIGGN